MILRVVVLSLLLATTCAPYVQPQPAPTVPASLPKPAKCSPCPASLPCLPCQKPVPCVRRPAPTLAQGPLPVRTIEEGCPPGLICLDTSGQIELIKRLGACER